MGGRSSNHVQTQSEIENFINGWRVGHITMPRPNLKFKIFGEGGGPVILPCPGQICNWKFMVGVDHLSMSRPNLKFKLFGEVGGQSSFHVQTESKISNFQWGWGVSHLFMSKPNLKFKSFSEGWWSRPNLKFKIFGEGGVWASYHVQAKSEIENLWWGVIIFPCPDPIWNLKLFGEVGGQSSFHVQTESKI